MIDNAQTIKQVITVPRMLDFYGFDTGPKKRIACPIHNGTNQNFGYKDHYWHCFVCGAGGDVIKFVQAYFRLTFQEAIRKLNDDFRLGLPIGTAPTLRQRREAEKIQKEAEAKRKIHDELVEAKEQALDEYVLTERLLRNYRPIRIEEVPEMYIYALNHINEAQARLEDAESRLYQYEHR